MVTASFLALAFAATTPAPVPARASVPIKGSVHGSRRMHAEWGPPPPVAPFVKSLLTTVRSVRPMIFPVLGPVRMTNGYNEPRATHRHSGMDIVAPKMTPIVAPFSGTLGMKRNTFWIWDDEGWGVLGTHLNDDNPGTNDNRGTRDVMFAPDLVPGQRVEAGRLIGYLGDSGDATGPHLHLELYAPGGRVGNTRGKLRNPEPSLHMAQRLSAPRVSLPADHDRPDRGELRVQGCIRKVIPGTETKPGQVTLLLTAKQDPTGRVRAVSKVRYLKVRVPNAAAQEVGGWDALASAPAHLTIGAYLDGGVPPDGALVRRLSTAPYRLD